MADPRESLGRLVRETWVAWAKEQYRPKPSWLLPWDGIDNGQREVDMRIGAAAAAAQRERDAALVRDMARNAVPGMARRWLYRAAEVIEGKSSDEEGAGHGQH